MILIVLQQNCKISYLTITRTTASVRNSAKKLHMRLLSSFLKSFSPILKSVAIFGPIFGQKKTLNAPSRTNAFISHIKGTQQYKQR